jgi:general secretion pathway protein M
MTAKTSIGSYLARFPWLAVTLYVALLFAFVLIAWSAVSDILERRAGLAEQRELLARLERRKPVASGTAAAIAARPAGSPFLEGPTVTVAEAALLQRAANAITESGGNVISTQVESQGEQAKAGYIAVTADCEIGQPELQKLLFDLEAGMPFLFVDQLEVQTAETLAGQQQGRMRVQFTVSGRWQGGK